MSDENIIDFTTANVRAEIAAVKAESMRQAKVRWHLFEIMKGAQIAPRALIRETLIALITAPATVPIENIRCEISVVAVTGASRLARQIRRQVVPPP